MDYFRKFSTRSFDWILVAAVMLLMAIGLEAIYSVDLSRGAELVYFKKQLIAMVAGLLIFFAASVTQHVFFRSFAKIFYAVSLALLVAVLFLGRTIRGTTGWFVFGGFSFQPVELAKVGVILILAYIISNFGRRFERPLFFFGTGIVTLLAIILILFQPDLGSAALIGLIWFGLMLLVGTRKIYLFGLIFSVVLAVVFSWFFVLHDYQKARLLTFIYPDRDPLGAGYNINQSIIAVGSGKWLGRGLGFGSQSQLRFLPEAQTDFIFSVIGEELGFAGAGVLLVLYGIVLWRLVLIMKRTNDDFVSATVGGIAILLFIQFLVNVGAEIGLLPLTGVTLPFVSYGGSSLIVNLFLIGVAESMVVRKY